MNKLGSAKVLWIFRAEGLPGVPGRCLGDRPSSEPYDVGLNNYQCVIRGILQAYDTIAVFFNNLGPEC